MTTLERAEAFAAALTHDLDRCAALERETMAIIAELSSMGQNSAALISAAVSLFFGIVRRRSSRPVTARHHRRRASAG
jgi:hypothetical protein